MNSPTLAYYDPIAQEWYAGWLKGFTDDYHAIIEKVGGGVIVLPDWQLRSLSLSIPTEGNTGESQIN